MMNQTQQTSSNDAAIEVVIRFNEALNIRDVETMMGLMTESCVFENTYPPPDGTRYEGREAVRAFWEDFFRSSRQAWLEIEEIFGLGQRCVMRWKYHWVDLAGQAGHIRGVDIYTVENGLITQKLSYVKG
jgi:ketosteroid isomerase-like protein